MTNKLAMVAERLAKGGRRGRRRRSDDLERFEPSKLAVAAARCETLIDNLEARERVTPVALSPTPLERTPALTRSQRARLAHAEVLAASKKRRDRDRAAAIAREVATERGQLTEVRALLARQAETKALGALRGETVETQTVRTGAFATDRHGVVVRDGDGLPVMVPTVEERTVVPTRDTLAALAKRLSAGEMEAGLRYRAAHELTMAGVRSQLGGAGGEPGGGGGPEAFEAARAQACLDKAAVDRAVALELRHEPMALDTLRRVVGDGVSIGALVGRTCRDDGAARSARERRAKALKAALGVAARVLKTGTASKIKTLVEPGYELGGVERPVAPPAVSERIIHVDSDGEPVREVIRIRKRERGA